MYRALVGQTVYQLRLYARSPRAVIASVATPVVLMVLLATISDNRTELGYHGSLAASMAALGLVSTCYTTLAASLVSSRDAGVLKRLRATPLPLWVHLTGRVAATTLIAAGQTAVVVGLAMMVYDVRLEPAGVLPAVGGLLLGAVAISLVGLAVAQLIPRGDAAATLLSTTLLPVVLISGLFFPVGELPGWVAHVSDALPLVHVLTLLEVGVGGSSGAADVAWLVGWATAGLAVALWRFRVEPPPPRTRRLGR